MANDPEKKGHFLPDGPASQAAKIEQQKRRNFLLTEGSGLPNWTPSSRVARGSRFDPGGGRVPAGSSPALDARLQVQPVKPRRY